MIRLVPVLLLMAAVAGGAVADPACLPDCNVENLIGHGVLPTWPVRACAAPRFANMAGASLSFAAPRWKRPTLSEANAARWPT